MPVPAPNSVRPPTLLALPSYLAGSVAVAGNRRLTAILRRHDLGLPQFAVLVALHDFGDLAPHELATRIQTDRSHISLYTEALVQRGLLQRVQDSSDRRRVIVGLTHQGADLTSVLIESAVESQAGFLGVLSEREQRSFRALLTKVIASTEAGVPIKE